MTQLTKLQQMQAMANQAAETGPDMTEAVKGGGGGRLLPQGYAMARLVQYVEAGMQPQEFQGKAKDPAQEFRLGFALWGVARDASGNEVGTFHNEDGTPYIIHTFWQANQRYEKARAFRLFKALNWKGTATHFAQLLGEPFLVKIIHVENKTDKTKKSSRIDLDGFLPAVDQLSGQPYPVPPARDEDLLLWLWDYPQKDVWDSFEIEGKDDNGKSKNWLQEKMLSALDFPGSALEQLLHGSSLALPSADAAAPSNPNPALPSDAPANPAADTGVGTPAMPAMPAMPS